MVLSDGTTVPLTPAPTMSPTPPPMATRPLDTIPPVMSPTPPPAHVVTQPPVMTPTPPPTTPPPVATAEPTTAPPVNPGTGELAPVGLLPKATVTGSSSEVTRDIFYLKVRASKCFVSLFETPGGQFVDFKAALCPLRSSMFVRNLPLCDDFHKRICLFLPPRLKYIFAFFGLRCLPAVALPLPYFDFGVFAQDGDLSTSWACTGDPQAGEVTNYECRAAFDLFSYRRVKQVKIGESTVPRASDYCWRPRAEVCLRWGAARTLLPVLSVHYL